MDYLGGYTYPGKRQEMRLIQPGLEISVAFLAFYWLSSNS